MERCRLFWLDEICSEGDWFSVFNWALSKMGNISKNRTHVLSFLWKLSSAQAPKTAHAQQVPMRQIKMRHRKQKLRREAEITNEGTGCFPFERMVSRMAVFITHFCMRKIGILINFLWFFIPHHMASVAQLDGPSDWRPGGRGFNPRRGRQHSFVEIDHEIFSTVILSLPLIQEGQLSVSGERMCTILINRLED